MGSHPGQEIVRALRISSVFLIYIIPLGMYLIYVFNFVSAQATVIVEVTGHTSQILDMAISENIVATADDSGLVKLFRIS